MIIDFHTHIFPDSLAPKAVASLQATAGIPVRFDGTASGLLKLMKNDGVDRAVVLNTVTNERQVGKVNAFALETKNNHPELIPFCSLHPLTQEPERLLEEFIAAGIKGIKLHPDYVGVMFDDDAFKPILSAAEKLGLPVIIHAGFDPVSPNKMHAPPDVILNVLSEFPNLILVAAHLGGVNCWDEAFKKLCGRNLYLDTAFCCERIGITIEQGKRIFDAHPHDKILFGSDAPWASPSEVLEFLDKLGLSSESREMILSGNAKRLLKL
ncbi:MAG: amidohydrolase [Clostridia bacterium]|nr:amidohydrolase [Clostridia bacterium]